MLNRILLLLVSLSFFASCRDNGVGCLGTLVCTEELRILTVEVNDINNMPVELDSSYSIHESASVHSFDSNDSGFITEGTYTLWTDVEMDLIKRKGSEIIFEGWLNNEKVVSEVFTIGHDCCHIELLDGTSEIIIK